MHRYRLLPGLALSGALAALAMLLANAGWLQSHGISALTLAIVLGIIVGNTLYPRIAEHSGVGLPCGVAFCKQTLLRAGVILYGLRLTLHDIGHVGLAGVVIDAMTLVSTYLLAQMLGTWLLGMDRKTSILIGAGSAICGAAAVMATEPVVQAEPEQVTIAVSTVVVFGTMAIFLYPQLYSLNLHWPFLPAGANAFGIYAGSTIHEVAQVVAAGRSVSLETANTAVITKLVRVMMLAPFLLALSAWLARDRVGVRCKPPLPWFAFGFIGVVMFNSLALLPGRVISVLIDLDTLLLAMAMAALGLSTHASALRKAGMKPLLLGSLLFAWLIIGGAGINTMVAGWSR